MTNYLIRQVDAIAYDDSWIYNDSFDLIEFHSEAKDEKRLFLKMLHSLGITFRRGTVRVVFDNDMWEVRERKTEKPLFCMVCPDLF